MLSAILSALFPVFGIIILGAVAVRSGFLASGVGGALNLFVYWVGLPALMFVCLARMDTGLLTPGYFAGMYLALLGSYLICYGVVSRGFRERGSEAVLFAYLSCFPNVAFMAVAMIGFLLPGHEEALSAAGLCAVLYGPIMMYTDIKLDMQRCRGMGLAAVLAKFGASVVKNPMLIASAVGAGFSISEYAAPAPLLNMGLMLGGTAAPCALFAMGMALAGQTTAVDGLAPGWFRRQVPVHLVKLLVLPLLTGVLLRAFGVSGVLLGVTVVCSAMPVGVIAYVIAEKFQVAVRDTSSCIFFNTGISIVTSSALIVVLRLLGFFA